MSSQGASASAVPSHAPRYQHEKTLFLDKKVEIGSGVCSTKFVEDEVDPQVSQTGNTVTLA